jgi:protein-tyrosine phosphatase
MQLDQILPNIYLGTCPESVTDIDWMQRQFGISAVLNLQTKDDFQAWHIDWDALETHYRTAGIALRRISIRDFDWDDLQRQLPLAVEALVELVDCSQVAYVHCTAGVNRSPTVVIAYLHWVQHRPLAEALDYVMQRRPSNPSIEAIEKAVWDGDTPPEANSPDDPK